MGGDYGSTPVLEGAVLAAKELGVEVILVGDESHIREQLQRLGSSHPRLTIRHASQTVDMHESPALVARKKRDSSVWVATELVKAGDVSAVVSAGNTGATMVAAFFILGMLKGVERPAIAATLPTLTGTAVMLDVGATVDCNAQHLGQFAIMGHEYGRHVFGKPNPRIGLLSIGEEDTKGNEVTKEAFKLLKACMICHGRSSAKAIKNAIRRAKGLAESRLNELIQRDIEESLALQQRADKGEAPE